MVRPKKTSEERRDDVVGVRLTAQERAELDRFAGYYGLSVSEFMRRRALGYRLPAGEIERRQRAAVMTALMRLGVNLNQIAHHMNAGRGAPANLSALSALIARIDTEMDRLYDGIA